jgi:hypothetical protein
MLEKFVASGIRVYLLKCISLIVATSVLYPNSRQTAVEMGVEWSIGPRVRSTLTLGMGEYFWAEFFLRFYYDSNEYSKS